MRQDIAGYRQLRQVDEDCVDTDQTNLLPRDLQIRLSPEQTEKTRCAGDDDAPDLPAGYIEIDVENLAVIFAVPDADNVFCLQPAQAECFVHIDLLFPSVVLQFPVLKFMLAGRKLL